MTEKVWRLAKKPTAKFIKEFPEFSQLFSQLLFNRGFKTPAEVDEFMEPDYNQDLHDPFIFVDMKKAIDRIFKALEKKESILVYGDYDADGVSSSAVMVSIIRDLGGQVKVRIPFREKEGYGLNPEAVKEIIENKVNLVITVDCGVGNVEEVAGLQDKGIDVIITDHHSEPETLPKALALINPNLKREKYPFKGLSGAGVAFKVAQALSSEHSKYKVTPLPEGYEKWLLDLVSIGTVADMMQLLGENRTIVHFGIVVLRKTKRVGLQALSKQMKYSLAEADAGTIGFQIGPRLNAAGRLNHASTAYQLLVTEDREEATSLADELEATNKERQRITDEIKKEAKAQIGEVKTQKLLAAHGAGWPTGVVGLVSGRITDEFHRPSLVIGKSQAGLVGSGRSIPGFDITAALRSSSEFLERFGGHKQACGFTIKDEASLQPFIDKMTNLAAKKLSNKDIQKVVEVEAEVDIVEVNWDLWEDLRKLEPYGVGNPQPILLAKEVVVSEISTVGADGRHLRLQVRGDEGNVKMIGFGLGKWANKLSEGSKIDVVFQLETNEWNGNRELQLRMVDLKLSK
ncbi:single-stranded-DNA-specific exonuclease RecJ [bacterium]|nr:single-stranded-DNA-specific exonuclease RecJ [bacterium]